jgi:hypothetical protein
MRSPSQIAADVLTKIAEGYDAYGNVIAPEFPVMPVGLGAALGGVAAHTFPTQRAKELREMAEKVPKTDKKMVIKLQDLEKKIHTSEPMTAEAAKSLFKNQALRANALRMLGGVGAGAVGGYALSHLLGNE